MNTVKRSIVVRSVAPEFANTVVENQNARTVALVDANMDESWRVVAIAEPGCVNTTTGNTNVNNAAPVSVNTEISSRIVKGVVPLGANTRLDKINAQNVASPRLKRREAERGSWLRCNQNKRRVSRSTSMNRDVEINWL